MKNDNDLKQDVMDELAWEPLVNENRIGVEVENGIVTLTGNLDSYAEKLAAKWAAMRVAGVRGLAMDINVNVPDTHRRTDADIANAANMALGWNINVPQEEIKVIVEDGVLTLSGGVAADFQREAAERAVRDLVGVKEVHNGITVTPAIVPEDVSSKIKAALHRQADIDAQDITVTVEGDAVILSGSVSSWAERNAALRAASAAPGVARVMDRMEISS